MASKSDRNSLIKCSHLLYTNRTAESAFRQTRMSSRAGADYVPRMKGTGIAPGLLRFLAPTLRFHDPPPRMGLPARFPCPSQFVPSVASW